MFEVGFWELLLIGVVLLLVLGPERLPEVAKQATFFMRKLRQSMYRLRQEMHHELSDSPFSPLNEAQHQMTALKNDVTQLGRDLADAVEQQPSNTVKANEKTNETVKKITKKTATKKTAVKKKATKKKVAKKTVTKKKVAKRITKKTAKKKSTKKA